MNKKRVSNLRRILKIIINKNRIIKNQHKLIENNTSIIKIITDNQGTHINIMKIMNDEQNTITELNKNMIDVIKPMSDIQVKTIENNASIKELNETGKKISSSLNLANVVIFCIFIFANLIYYK